MPIEAFTAIAEVVKETVAEVVGEAVEETAEVLGEMSEDLATEISDISANDIDINDIDTPISDALEPWEDCQWSDNTMESAESDFSGINELDAFEYMEWSDLPNEAIDIDSLDIPVSESMTGVDVRNCPINDGQWTGERGNSKWIPDEDYIFKKYNPDELTAGEIMDKFGIDGIDFKDGEPDFSKISKGEVQIDEFSADRDDNFDLARKKLAEIKNCLPKDVEAWEEANKYTWHECKDMCTMQKVPSIVHGNVTHRGGVSNYISGGKN